MKRICILLLCVLISISVVFSAFSEGNKTRIENATFFSQLYATEVVDTEEHRNQTVAIILGYVVGQKDNDEFCKEFCEVFQDNWGDMKVVIGAHKKGATIVFMALRNGLYYSFNVTHFPSLNISRPEYRQYDEAVIDVEKYERSYDDFEKTMAKFGKKNNIKFYDITSYDVMSAYFNLFAPDSAENGDI